VPGLRAAPHREGSVRSTRLQLHCCHPSRAAPTATKASDSRFPSLSGGTPWTRPTRAAAQWEGTAAAERERLRKRAITEQRYLPRFEEGDTLRLAVLTPAGDAQWLDAYEATSSRTEERYRLEASYWLTPLPRDGLFTVVCAWPEIGLPEVVTDVVLPDLAVRAAGARGLWDVAEDF
jgi:hypothetical protein